MKYTLKAENSLSLHEVELWKHSRTQSWGGEGLGEWAVLIAGRRNRRMARAEYFLVICYIRHWKINNFREKTKQSVLIAKVATVCLSSALCSRAQ